MHYFTERFYAWYITDIHDKICLTRDTLIVNLWGELDNLGEKQLNEYMNLKTLTKAGLLSGETINGAISLISQAKTFVNVL